MNTISSANIGFINMVSFLPENSIHYQVIKRVLEDLGQSLPAFKLAIFKFFELYEMNYFENANPEIIKPVESEEVIEAIIQLQKVRIEYEALHYMLSLAQENIDIAKEILRLKVEKCEKIGNEVDWSVDVFKLLILKNNPKTEVAFQKVLKFVKSMADGSAGLPLESICNGGLPRRIERAVDQLKGFKMGKLIRDLAELLQMNDKVNSRKVLEICKDIQAAKEAAINEGLPDALNSLALIILKYIKKCI